LESFEYLGEDFGKVSLVAGKKRIVEHRPWLIILCDLSRIGK
jgi:hypothetical protein